jgi:hypothetical protein
MEIQFVYLPILVCVLSWFLGWVFSGFADGLEAIAGNPVTMVFSIIAYLSGIVCLIYYPGKFLIWLYNNITIVF